MSNFNFKAKHKKTGEIVEVTAIDTREYSEYNYIYKLGGAGIFSKKEFDKRYESLETLNISNIEISFCHKCLSMTHITKRDKCGKCGADKSIPKEESFSLQQTWEEEFEKRFHVVDNRIGDRLRGYSTLDIGPKIKDFIQSTLQSERSKLKQELREKIEKIDVSGGGSGRRLKIQILKLLE